MAAKSYPQYDQNEFAFQRGWANSLLHAGSASAPEAVSGLQKAWGFSTDVLLNVERNLARTSLDGVATVALAGSFGRMEGNANSDFDLVVIAAENRANDRNDENALFQLVWSELAEMSLVPPDDHGIFKRVVCPSVLYSDDALGNLDYPKHVFGLRMQLLSDCQPMVSAQAFEDLQRNIIRWYCLPGYSPFSVNPLQYLLSDIKRYFHSYANWHQYRFDQTFNDSWLMRQIKMSHSRLASYTALVFCILDIASKIDSVHSANNEQRIGELLVPMLRMTPIERLIYHWPEQSHRQLIEYLQRYDQVSRTIAEPVIRQALINCPAQPVSDIRKLPAAFSLGPEPELQGVFVELIEHAKRMRQLLSDSTQQLTINSKQAGEIWRL